VFPADKSISHRPSSWGPLSVGETRISGLMEGEDVLNTAKSMRAMGAAVERTGDFAWLVRGVGVAGFRAGPRMRFDFGNSGTGCRLGDGGGAGCPITAVFDGDASLRTRPMRRVLDPLELMGAKVSGSETGGPAAADASRRHRPGPDSLSHAGRLGPDQVPPFLLAGLAAPGVTTVIEQEASRDHTELMLKPFWRRNYLRARRPPRPQDRARGHPELHGANVVCPPTPPRRHFPLLRPWSWRAPISFCPTS